MPLRIRGVAGSSADQRRGGVRASSVLEGSVSLRNPANGLSTQIPGSSAVQCYCPATGRILGQVNPSTADGIDRAIARAKEAQVEWAKTTFAQRRKVLRTMLR